MATLPLKAAVNNKTSETTTASASAAAAPAAVEASAGKLAELKVGTVKEVKVGEVTVLVGQTSKGYFASGSKCTHYGAPLRTGVLVGDRVMCPWHGACFHVHSGDIEEAPALSALPSYPVRVAGDELFVTVTQTENDIKSIRPTTCPATTAATAAPSAAAAAATASASAATGAGAGAAKSNARKFVVVGAGPAAMACIETLRSSSVGYTGHIALIGSDATLPPDRPMLSKNLANAALKPDALLLRPAAWFAAHNVDVYTGHAAIGLNAATRTLTARNLLSGSQNAVEFHFDQLMIATGARARPLVVPTVDTAPADAAAQAAVKALAALAAAPAATAASASATASASDVKSSSSSTTSPSNVFTIRNVSDAAGVFRTVDDDACAHAVIVGSGFIGLEVAAWLTKNEMTSITVVQRSPLPLEGVFGARIGKALLADHQSHKIQFVTGEVGAFETASGVVHTVVLKSGQKLPANIVIVGLGAVLNTDFLKGADSGIKLNADGGVVVDSHMQTVVAGVYACGDIADHPCTVTPLTTAGGQARARIEHWNVAHQHGRVAAHNMAAGANAALRRAYTSVPYFWTMQYASIRLCGNPRGYDDVVYDGAVEDKKFVAYFGRAGAVIAVASMARDPVVSAAAELMRDKRMPSIAQIKAGGVSLLSLLTPSA